MLVYPSIIYFLFFLIFFFTVLFFLSIYHCQKLKDDYTYRYGNKERDEDYDIFWKKFLPLIRDSIFIFYPRKIKGYNNGGFIFLAIIFALVPTYLFHNVLFWEIPTVYFVEDNGEEQTYHYRFLFGDKVKINEDRVITMPSHVLLVNNSSRSVIHGEITYAKKRNDGKSGIKINTLKSNEYVSIPGNPEYCFERISNIASTSSSSTKYLYKYFIDDPQKAEEHRIIKVLPE